MIAIFYFFMIRPNKKRMQQQQNMYDNLKVGDAVVTIGGLHGVIDEIINENRTVVLDCEGIYLTFEIRAIARVVTKAAPQTMSNEEVVDEMSSNTPTSASEDEDEDV